MKPTLSAMGLSLSMRGEASIGGGDFSQVTGCPLEEVVESLRRGIKSTVLGMLGNKTKYIGPILDAMSAEAFDEAESSAGIRETGTLIESIRSAGKVLPPQEVKLRGTLFPALLLYRGWWEGKDNDFKNIRWKDGLQEWLFHGFHQWGPSWDVNADFDGDIIAQLAGDDEAESLPLVIHAEKMHDDVRAACLAGRPCRVVLRARLCHRSHPDFPAKLKAKARENGDKRNFEYCLLLHKENRKHKLEPAADRVALYSGYLWQCWAVKESLRNNPNPALNDVFFAWEHTDFTKPAALEYNLESLSQKAGYLEKKLGGTLILLQNSCRAIPGSSLYDRKQFSDFMWRKA
jgi:hypothetical protein